MYFSYFRLLMQSRLHRVVYIQEIQMYYVWHSYKLNI